MKAIVGAERVLPDVATLTGTPPAMENERDGPNPFGNDFDLRPEKLERRGEVGIDFARDFDTQKSTRDVESEAPVEEATEDFAWAPISKKDKKKKKKSHTATTAEETPFDTPSEPIETPSEPIESSREQVEDEWAVPTSKKGKKGKKDKKRNTLDWTDDVAPAAGAAAAIAAGAAIGASAFDGDEEARHGR